MNTEVEFTWQDLALHMSNKKSLNHLDYQYTPPATWKETLDKKKFFIGTIFEVKNSNQQINTIDKETNTEWSVTLNINGTNICNKIDSVAQVNVVSKNQSETLQTKPTITTLRTTLSTYYGNNIPVIWQCTLD